MRIFVDTNIISEFLEARSQVDYVDRIFAEAERNQWSRVLSVGSLYTVTFLIERFLRHNGIGQPQLVELQRSILLPILENFEIKDLDRDILLYGVSDSRFQDLEDSYQYQAAVNAKCSVLLTINKKDFKNVNGDEIVIVTPQEFIEKYLV
jgi:predicted nucleic acid-binding protein